jgi:hypothetical protein
VNLRWKKALISSAVAITGFMAFGGFLHTSAGRPLLRRIGGCPVGNVSPAIVQADRDRIVSGERGNIAAPDRQIFGFTLRGDDLDSIKAWSKKNRLECEVKREGTVYYCGKAPANLVDPTASADDVLEELVFGFRVETKKLESVQTFRTRLTPEQAARHANRVRERLLTRLGQPASEAAPENAKPPYSAAMLSKPYATVAIGYRFSDLIVDVTSTNVTGTGSTFRENYLSGLAGS